MLVNIRGNKPLLLEKIIYTEHPLAKNLKDVSISEYNPNWNKTRVEKQILKKPLKNDLKQEEKNVESEVITFDNF